MKKKQKAKKIIKRIGIVLLLIAMAYASNWDLPKQTKDDWTAEHQAELEEYEQIKEARRAAATVND